MNIATSCEQCELVHFVVINLNDVKEKDEIEHNLENQRLN